MFPTAVVTAVLAGTAGAWAASLLGRVSDVAGTSLAEVRVEVVEVHRHAAASS